MGSKQPQDTRKAFAFASRECSIVEDYREHHREIFLESFLYFFVGHFHCTKTELKKLRTGVKARSQRLRQIPRKRGRPPGKVKSPMQEQIEQRGATFDPHDSFRSVCAIWADRDRTALLKQGLLFVETANQKELAGIRKWIAGRERQKWQAHPGQPRALQDDETHQRALQVVWLRYVKHKRWKEIQESLIAAAFGDESFITVRRLQDYFADLIYRKVQPDWITQAGGLDGEKTKAYLRFETGLPFDTHPGECKRIVTELWPQGFRVYWKRFEQNEGRKQNAE